MSRIESTSRIIPITQVARAALSVRRPRRFAGGCRNVLGAVAALLLVAACSSTPPITNAPPSAAPAAPAAAASAARPAPAPAPAARGKRGAITDRGAITLAGNCNQKEIDGFAERASVTVDKGQVRALSWDITIGKQGTCRFDGRDFRQTKSQPSIEMQALDGSGCKLMMWADPRRVTLAHAGCTQRCTRGVYDKAWPVMFDPRSGGCANIDR